MTNAVIHKSNRQYRRYFDSLKEGTPAATHPLGFYAKLKNQNQ